MNPPKEENIAQLRDWLAVERTKLANQRTLLAMVRTGLYFLVMGLSIVSIEQLDPLQKYYWIFFIMGIGFIASGIIYYLKLNKKIASKYTSTL
jgi:putative membrane protein